MNELIDQTQDNSSLKIIENTLSIRELSQRMLSKIEPKTFAKAKDGRQQRKSAETRICILEATVDCLVEKGYAALSIRDIIDRANVSRGAMHHHFANKAKLVAAVIEYTFYKRMEKFLCDYIKIRAIESDFTRAATEVHWKNVQSREYSAYLELAVAARTNKALNDSFLPMAKRYDQVWCEEMHKTFPEWQGSIENFNRANDFAIVVHMGMLLNAPILGNEQRMKNIHEILHKAIIQLFTDITSD